MVFLFYKIFIKKKDLRKEIIQLFYLNDIKDILITATYVQTFGPRFETKSEIKFLSTVGDIVGNYSF